MVKFDNNFGNSKAATPSFCPRMSGRLLLSVLFIPFLLFSTAPSVSGDVRGKLQHLETGAAWVYSLEAVFDEVKDSLVEVIESRGMVVSYISHAKEMLSRTAVTTGGMTVYSDAEVLLFCKADLAHQLVAASPHNLVLCPYAIAVYGLIKEPGIIFISIRQPEPKVAGYERVHQLLQDVIAEAVAEQ